MCPDERLDGLWGGGGVQEFIRDGGGEGGSPRDRKGLLNINSKGERLLGRWSSVEGRQSKSRGRNLMGPE